MVEDMMQLEAQVVLVEEVDTKINQVAAELLIKDMQVEAVKVLLQDILLEVEEVLLKQEIQTDKVTVEMVLQYL